jgi:hypothetical protein
MSFPASVNRFVWSERLIDFLRCSDSDDFAFVYGNRAVFDNAFYASIVTIVPF